ncbi:hypothetical protein MMC28_005751 [Mycoblastus sanguinarius]|nr:hypothetical protein [Mycoblastus sanguinarius]
MSIFKPTLKNVKRIAIAKVEWNKVQYETAAVVSDKTVDTLRFIISGPPFMTNVFMRVVNGYDGSLLYDEGWAALKIQNGREG